MATSGVIVEAMAAGMGLPRSSSSVTYKVLRDEGLVRTGPRGRSALHLTTQEVVRLMLGITSPLAVDAPDVVRGYEALPLAAVRSRHAWRGGDDPYLTTRSQHGRTGFNDRTPMPNELTASTIGRAPLADAAPGSGFGSILATLLDAYVSGAHRPPLFEHDFRVEVRRAGDGPHDRATVVPEEARGTGAPVEYTVGVEVRLMRPEPAASLTYAWRVRPREGHARGRKLLSMQYLFGENAGDDHDMYSERLAELDPAQYWWSTFHFNQRVFERVADVMRAYGPVKVAARGGGNLVGRIRETKPYLSRRRGSER